MLFLKWLQGGFFAHVEVGIVASWETVACKEKAKCGGLSTARRTMKLSVASVEMTTFGLGERKRDADFWSAQTIFGRVKRKRDDDWVVKR
jgi:hypothetical protein